MAGAVRLFVNPADKTKRYVLWTNGYLQPIGGAPPVAQTEQHWGDASVAPAAPTFYWNDGGFPIVSGQITTFGATPAGYFLDRWGYVNEWGGATAPTGPDHGAPNVGFFLPVYGYYFDFYMNPAANGQGYALNFDGDLIAFGTGTPAVAHSAFLTGSGYVAIRLYMDWASKRYWVLDDGGRWWGKNGGNNLAVDGLPPLGTFIGPNQGIPFSGDLYDMAATATPHGWHMRADALTNEISGAQVPYGAPYNAAYKGWIDLKIIDNGLSANPLKLAALSEVGWVYDWVVSTAPTAVVTQPNTATVTDTSRPFIGWSYSDKEGDAQSKYEVGLFTAAQYGIGGFDPAVSPATFRYTGTDAGTRSIQPTVDLTNGVAYRAYVRVTDTANMVSNWAFFGWTQSIVRPVTPTVTPTVLGNLTGISLLLNRSTAITNGRLGVQYHDADWDGVTWLWVKAGWDLVPDGSGNATVVDYGAGFGVQRTYRATHYVYTAATGTWNGSDFSTVANATITDKTKWVLASADNNDAVAVKVTEDIQFARDVPSTVFWLAGRRDPIVIRDGAPRLAKIPIKMWSLDNTTRVALEALFDSGVLLLRDPYGHRYYAAFVDSQIQIPMRAGPNVGETTPLRDANQYTITLQAVARPRTGPTAGPLAV